MKYQGKESKMMGDELEEEILNADQEKAEKEKRKRVTEDGKQNSDALSTKSSSHKTDPGLERSTDLLFT